jgi:uncharacterized protein
MEEQKSGAGGTPGGVGQFFLGLGMAVAGGWLLLNQVKVSSGGWFIWGYNAFGLSLVPFIFGVGFLFFNGKSVIGWLLTFSGLVIIFAGIITNLNIYFRSTTLFNTLMMLTLLAGGVGLLARSLSSKPQAG